MAIIIPSKKIYEIENPKIVENAIKSIDIKQKLNEIVISNLETEQLTQELSSGTIRTEENSLFILKNDYQPIDNKFSGRWTLNSSISLTNNLISSPMQFKSNNKIFNEIAVTEYGLVYKSSTETVNVYFTEWTDPLYQEIDFIGVQTPSEDIANWLKSNGSWFVQLWGGKATSKVFSTTANLKRKYDDYYITSIAPTLSVDFDVIISEIAATASWTETNPQIEFYDDSVFSTRETVCYNYVFDFENTQYEHQDNLSYKTNISITPESIFAYFVTMFGKDVLDTREITAYKSQINSAPYPYSIRISSETEDEYNLDIELTNNLTVYSAQAYKKSPSFGNFGTPTTAVKINLIAKNAKIVFNETTRKLLVKDKDIALINLSAKGENTYSVSSNQFIRDETKYNGSQGATGILYNQTLSSYENGKETAILRCSVGDYYDHNNAKQISICSSNKMLFEEYDEVVPMLLNSWGEDSPISYNSNGLAKTFKVVGIRHIADGAVWQELTLRESGAISIKIRLPKPLLTLINNTLVITEQSGIATSFNLYVNGQFVASVPKNETLDLTTLNLAKGKYYITAESCNINYKTSKKSSAIVYTIKPLVEYYVEENESGGLTYYIKAESYTEVDGTYVIGD